MGVLIATGGAILAFATTAHVSGLNLHMVGGILIIAGITWAVIGAVLYQNQRRGTVVTERRRLDGGDIAVPEETYEERRTYDEPPETSEGHPFFDRPTFPEQRDPY